MKNSQNKIFDIYTDGASRGNPGPSAIAFVIYSNNEKVAQKAQYIGINTNNFAEYYAVYNALNYVKKFNPSEVNVYTDSNLIYNQINGYWKIKDELLKDIANKILNEIKTIRVFNIFYIPREKNKEADKLVNIQLNLAKAKGLNY